MQMNRLVRVILALAAVAVVALASACGTSESGEWEWVSTSEETEGIGDVVRQGGLGRDGGVRPGAGDYDGR